MTTVSVQATVVAAPSMDAQNAITNSHSISKSMGQTIALKKKKSKKIRLKKPAGVKAWASSCYEGHVTWKPVKNAQGYRIYRSVYKKKKYKKVATVYSNSFYDCSLIASKTYYYKVKAFRGKKSTSYSAIKSLKTTARPNGNAACYDLANVKILADNELKGKTILFLGSSITYGSASGGIAFPDYIAKRNQLNYENTDIEHTMKQAVPGKTMACVGDGQSYVERIARLDQYENADIFLCQLSVNDANQVKELGVSTGSADVVAEPTEVKTVGQAIDYIIYHAHKQWPDAQIAFFTCRNNGNARYAQMVQILKDAKAVWADEGVNIEILDLWSDSGIKNLTGNAYIKYMADGNHPTKAGYLELWTPRFETFLKMILPRTQQEPEQQMEPEQVQDQKFEQQSTQFEPVPVEPLEQQDEVSEGTQ